MPRRLERVRNVPLFWSTQPWFDPDNAPLNTAALFVGVAASLVLIVEEFSRRRVVMLKAMLEE